MSGSIDDTRAGSTPSIAEHRDEKQTAPDTRERRWERTGWELWLLPMLAVLAFVFAIPIVSLISVSFHSMSGPAQVDEALTVSNYLTFLTDSFFLVILLDTFWLGATVVACCLVISYPLSYFLARTQSRFRGILLFLVLSPLLISAVVRNIGWFPILAKSGLVNWVLINLGIVDAPLALKGN